MVRPPVRAARSPRPRSIGPGKFALGLFVRALACSVISNAVLVMISVTTTPAIAVGLLRAGLGDFPLIADFVDGVGLLSISHYGLGIANAFVDELAPAGAPGLLTSVVMGAIVTVGALVLAINLLSGFTLKGEPA